MPLSAKSEFNSVSLESHSGVPDISDASLDWHQRGERQFSPSEAWSRWLFDPGSLTQLLIQKSGGDFRVQVRAEQWVSLPSSELRSCFGPLEDGHKFWSRKVALVGNGNVWVLAHTLIPEISLMSPLKRVLELNQKPLGEYLFSHPDLIRSGMEITQTPGGSWGRRSLFYLFGKPIMVAEFFLPAILD
jgi:chorismate lyase